MDCTLVQVPWCPDNPDRHACLDKMTAFDIDLPIGRYGTYVEGVRAYIATGWPGKPGVWLVIDHDSDPVGGMLVTIDAQGNVTQGITTTTSAVPRLTTWPPKK